MSSMLRSLGTKVYPARNWWLGAASFGVLLVVGAGTAWNPLATAGAVAGIIAFSFALLFASRLPKFFLATLGILLLGYAFLNRGFAYLGVSPFFVSDLRVPPLFVSEMVLALGLLTLAVCGGMRSALRSFLSWLLIVFALWGAIRTVPYLGTYGWDALRDGVVWGYGAFALLVAAFLPRSGLLLSLPERYGRWLPWFLLWVPIAGVIYRLGGDLLPRVPGSDVALLHFKSGDAAVHLAGAATFLFLGLHQFSIRQSKTLFRPKEWIWWMAWLAGFLVVASRNRGGLLAVLVAALVVILLQPFSRWGKVALIVVVLATVSFGFDAEIDLGDGTRGRKVSIQQIITNVQSIFVTSPHYGLESTREWRLRWWSDIVDYTIFGEYFWTGKGFGINLAADDGYRGGLNPTLRSPHNGHLTVLARAGVPGLALWVLLQGAFGISLLRAYFRARRIRKTWWARVNLWILAYWTAFMVNGMFDVFLEGPQGAIWFWSLFGFGIAVLNAQNRQWSRNTAHVSAQSG